MIVVLSMGVVAGLMIRRVLPTTVARAKPSAQPVCVEDILGQESALPLILSREFGELSGHVNPDDAQPVSKTAPLLRDVRLLQRLVPRNNRNAKYDDCVVGVSEKLLWTLYSTCLVALTNFCQVPKIMNLMIASDISWCKMTDVRFSIRYSRM